MRCPKVMRARTRTKLFFLPRLRCDIVEMRLLMCWECIENLYKFNRKCLTDRGATLQKSEINA